MNQNTRTKLEQLSNCLQYQFKTESLLLEALSHRSTGSHNYERLEFLGDSILGLVISAELYSLHPTASEGDLSRLRASLVNENALSGISRELGLGEHLRLGSGELKSGGYKRDSILADVLESLLGAIFLDSDFATVQTIILRLFAGRITRLPDADKLKDPKTRLQEILQGAGIERPAYHLVKTTGKSHQQEFTVSCVVTGLPDSADSHDFSKADSLTIISVEATGSSRRKAEQAAAKIVLGKKELVRLPK